MYSAKTTCSLCCVCKSFRAKAGDKSLFVLQFEALKLPVKFDHIFFYFNYLIFIVLADVARDLAV